MCCVMAVQMFSKILNSKIMKKITRTVNDIIAAQNQVNESLQNAVDVHREEIAKQQAVIEKANAIINSNQAEIEKALALAKSNGHRIN